MAEVPDHGTITRQGNGFYGWLVAIASHICYLFVFGMMTATGVLVVAIQQSFDYSSARVSWIISLQFLFQLTIGPVTNVIVKKIGFRMTVVIGTLAAIVGMFLSAFANSVEFLYFSHGTLVGFGYGLVTPVALGIVPLYINHNFVVAIAIVQTGSGIGNLMFPHVMQSLIDYYGWRGASIVFAAIHANMLIPAALFKAPNGQRGRTVPKTEKITTVELESDSESENETKGRRSSTFSDLRKILTLCDCSLFVKHPMFIAYTVSRFFDGLGFSGSVMHLIARARELRIGTDKEIATVASVFAIGGLLGKMSVPLFVKFSCKCLTTLRLFGLTYLMAGAADILSAVSTTYVLYTVFAFSLGFLSGIFYTLLAQVLKDMLGPAMVTAAVSLSSPFEAIGGLIGPPCAGALFDLTGDYNYSFYFYGASLLISGSVLLICDLFKRRRQVGRTGYTVPTLQ
ncbi:monocarboxylate transporter 13-like [Ptychodera flava]|uniref:monocarboxylate transporter 13-like n=1 Tax=Ptychodera flava TaxID=63121 RepID=UPI003969F29C